ncbi:hypothetical protein Sste5346_002671 [Sporothrix stenoceras]|uniref:Uncharacterized protein n=1 Tax=Sporothrix stenoceras TaxID=5173 RepID=A0ABR3ZIC5_9PEZI
MSSQRSSRLRRSSAFLMLLAATLLLTAPASVMADDSADVTTSGPVTANPMGLGPAVTPVINASFTSSFDSITQGQTLNLTWSPIDAKYEPLSITARAINRTLGNRANSFLVTIAPHLTNTSMFTWKMVPFPLQFMPTGIYEVEIRPAIWNLSANEPGSLTVPVLARSSFFSITKDGSSGSQMGSGSASGSHTGNTLPGDDPNQLMYGQSETKSSHSSSAHRRLALGLGISLGVAGALALVGILYVARRRHLCKAAEAQRQLEKREDFGVE